MVWGLLVIVMVVFGVAVCIGIRVVVEVSLLNHKQHYIVMIMSADIVIIITLSNLL